MYENSTLEPPLPANSNSVIANIVVTEQLVAPVARLWCRSFGITNEGTIERLAKALRPKAQEELANAIGFDRAQSRFDELAAQLIRDWFSFVLGRIIPADGKELAILRLAFLECNHEGKWSAAFLAKNFCVQELAAELEAMTIEPTPQASPRAIVRQIF